MAMKENDWILDGIVNPEKHLDDFLISGYNTSNTQLLSKDDYKKNTIVQQAFTENGAFNDVKFNEFYKNKATEYGKMQQMSNVDTFEYNPFDVEAPKNAYYKSPEFNLIRINNPLRDKTTMTGAVYESGLSQREIAQQNKIYDSSTGTFSNDTLVDRALSVSPLKWMKELFASPIVYATYDDNGTHIDQITGEKVKHQKGQFKLNAFGEPYTEKLNGNSLIGKEVVSVFDNLTVDGEGINKYDFFDSDGVDKSITGTVMKGAATLAPMFIPGAGEYYAGMMVVKELSKALPMLYGVIAPWVDLPDEQPILNTIAGVGKKFSQGQSDVSNLSVFNKEQFANLITDVALQWGQQMFVSNTIQKLKGTKDLMNTANSKAFTNYLGARAGASEMVRTGEMTQKHFDRLFGEVAKWNESIFGKSSIEAATKGVEEIMQKSSRLGADASLIYMALVSNTDVYDTMRQAGATGKEAAAVTLASTAGMFGVDRYLHLGEVFFDDLTTPTVQQIRRTQRKAAQSFIDNGILDKQLIDGVAETSTSRIKRLMKAGLDIGKRGVSDYMESLKYHTTGMFGKALGEGIEETTEELVTDISKGLYELAGSLGADTSVKDVGAWDNMLERYGMSFLGGFIGGGVYYGKDVAKNGKFQIDTTQDDYMYLVSNGKTQQALDSLEKAHKKGQLASTDLSMETTTDENGNKVYLSAGQGKESQNDYVYNRLKDVILQLDGIIGNVDGKKSDEDLLDQILLKESRFQDLKDYLHLKDFSYLTGYQQEYRKLLNNIVDLQGMYDRALQTKTGMAYSLDEEFEANRITDLEKRNLSEQEIQERDKNLNEILKQLNAAKAELNKYNSGEYSLDYMDKMLFAMDESVNQNFVSLNFESWLNKNHDGKKPEELTESEKTKYKKEYLDYKQAKQKEDLTIAYKQYKDIGNLINPVLKELMNNQEEFKNQKELIDELSKLKYSQYGWNSVLDFIGETEESPEYKNRDNELTRDERARIIQEENNKISKEFFKNLEQIIKKYGDYIDPATKRQLKLVLANRKKDFLQNYIENLKNNLYKNMVINGEIVERNVLSDVDDLFLNLVEQYNKTGDQSVVINGLKQYLIDRNYKRYNFFNNLLEDYFQNEKVDLNDQEIRDEINNAGYGDNEFLPELYDLFNGKSGDEIEQVWNEITKNRTRNDIEKNIDNINTTIGTEFNNYLTEFYKYVQNINSDSNIKTFNLLEEKVKNTGIVNSLIKKIASKLNTNIDVESMLLNLEQILDSAESKDDFVISNATIEDLQEIQNILKLVQSYVFASAKIPNFMSPAGHNSTINEMAENHKDLFKNHEELPVLDPDQANTIMAVLEQYINQIGVEDEKTGTYNFNSYLYLSQLNAVNKAKAHEKTDKALNLALTKLLQNRNSFKFEFKGVKYDLMEGAETIVEDTEFQYITFNRYATIFYNNVQKLIKDGWTYKDIFERSGILEKISAFDTNTQDFIDQKTTSIDQKITYDRMTSYDKIVNLLTIMSIDPKKYNIYLQKRIEEEGNKVPLTAQEWISRIGIALEENVDIFNSAMNYIVSTLENNNKTIEKAVFRNTIFINANQGAGKTNVCAKNIVSWDQKTIVWISAPKERQVNSLFDSIGNGIRMINRSEITVNSNTSPSLISRIIKNKEEYDKVMTYLNGNSNDIPKCISVLTNDESDYFKIDYKKLGIEKDSDAPNIIVIDEATHLSLFELDCIQHYCNLNNVKLILLGDNKQNGYSGIGRNIRPSAVFMWRSQNLNISLRDNNIQHNRNLSIVENLLDACLDTKDSNILQVEKIYAAIKSLNFRYCLKNGINGDVLIEKLSDELLSELNGDIGYIGKETDKEFKQLQNAGLNVTALNSLDMQGQEFDYIVVNKDFEIPSSSNLFQNFSLLQDVYTMMSRGRNGSIIIDPINKLQDYIGKNIIETVTSRSGNILDYAKEFQQKKIEMLKKINEGTTPTKNTTSSTTTSATETPSATTTTSTSSPSGSSSTNGTTGNTTSGTVTPTIEIKIPYEREGNAEIPIQTDIDFKKDGVPFDKLKDNYYVLYSIVNDFENPVPPDGTHKIGDVKKASSQSTIDNAIEKLKPGQNLILYVIPKIEGLGINISGSKIINKLVEENEFTVDNIPNKYIYKIIQKGNIENIVDDSIPDPVVEPKRPKLTSEEEDNFTIDDSIPEGNMLAYGKISFTGLKREYDKNGLEIWINSHDSKKTKRDMELFTNDGEVIDPSENGKQVELSILIKKFKNGILYKTEYKDLGQEIKNVISKKEYDNMKFQITVRKKTEKDNFIRNIGISEEKSTIDDYLFVVEAVFKTKDGNDGILSIGLMGSPETWKNSADNNIKKYEKKIEELEEKKKKTTSQKNITYIEEQIKHYKQLIDNNNKDDSNSAINKYINYIKTLKSKAEKSSDGTYSEEIDIRSSGMTDIHKTGRWHRIVKITSATIDSIESFIDKCKQELKDEHITVGRKERLEDSIEKAENKIKELKEIQENSFSSLNPYTIIGDKMLVYTGNSLDLDDSINGRYVAMLVSNDPTLTSDQLLGEYLKQKQNQKNHIDGTTPRVRLIPLNPVGVSFQDLSSPYMRDALSTNINTKNGAMTQIFPFKTHYMGVRMYTAMWNFRANLLQFTDRAKVFVDDLIKRGLIKDSDELDTYLLMKDLNYKDEKDWTENEKNFYNANKNLKNYKEISNEIDRFNKSLTDDYQIKRFRLGGGLKNGAYIREITGAQSLYGVDSDTRIFGIYGTTRILNNYLQAIESIFTNILDPIIHCKLSESKEGKKKILSNNTGVQNSFAGNITSLLTKNGYTKINNENGEKEKIKFSNNTGLNIAGIGNVFSHIPIVLSKSYRLILGKINQTHEDGSTKSDREIMIKTNGGTVEKEIDWAKVLNDVGGQKMGDQAIIDRDYSRVLNQKRFEDLFSFMFHGTVDDFHKSDIIKDTLAQFPNGLYADPLSTGQSIIQNGSSAFKVVAYQPYFWETDVSIGDPTFFVTIKNYTKEEKKKPEIKKQPIEPESKIDLIEKNINELEYSNDVKKDILEKVKKSFEGKENEINNDNIKDEIENTLNEYENNFTYILSSIENPDNYGEFIKTGDEIMTIAQWIAKICNFNKNEQIEEIQKKDQNIFTVTSNNGSKYNIIKGLNGEYLLGTTNVENENNEDMYKVLQTNIDSLIDKYIVNRGKNNKYKNEVKVALNQIKELELKQAGINEIGPKITALKDYLTTVLALDDIPQDINNKLNKIHDRNIPKICN